jgi:O-antigen ligase
MGLFSILLIMSALLMSKRPLFGLRTACDAFIIPFLGYFLARRLVTNEEQLHKFVKVIGYMSTYVIIIALIERMTHQELLYRLSGPFPTSNTLYVVLATSFFIVLAELSNKEIELKNSFIPFSVFKKCVAYLAPIIILLTLGRANWLGFILGIGTFIFMARKLMRFSTKVFSLGFLLLFACVMVIALPSLMPDELVNKRIGNIQNINARFGAWILIMNEGFNHPVLGMGIHNLRYLLAETNFSSWSGSIVSTAHNSFLAITAELGFVGLLMYTLVILSLLWTGLNQYRKGTNIQAKWRGIAVVSILIAYLTPALFANTVYIDVPLHHVYVYAYAGAIAGVYNQRRLIARLQPMSSLMRSPAARAHRFPVGVG